MICSKVAANSTIRKERYPRDAKRVTRIKGCVSLTPSSGKHGKIVETLAYDFLSS